MSYQAKNSINKILFLTSGIFIIFIIYLIFQASYNTVLFPTGSEIWDQFKTLFSFNGFKSLGYTIARLIVAILVSFVLSMAIAYFYYLYKPSVNIFKPFMYIMKVTPIIAIVFYISIIAIHKSTSPPYIVTIMVLTPIMSEAYLSAIDNIDKNTLDALKLEPNFNVKFFRVIIPMIAPSIFMSLFQCIGLGIKIVIMSEYFCFVDFGLGAILYNFYTYVDIAGIIAFIIYICLLAGIIDSITYIINKQVINKL